MLTLGTFHAVELFEIHIKFQGLIEVCDFHLELSIIQIYLIVLHWDSTVNISGRQCSHTL